MKRSRLVTLVISGALLAGCDNRPGGGDWQYGDQPLTNNTYAPGYGYWHAPYRGWFPYPYNTYVPNYGYYHGGIYTSSPNVSEITSSRPPGGYSARAGVIRGGFGRSGGIGA